MRIKKKLHWWKCKLVQSSWRTVGSFLKDTKPRATVCSSYPSPGMYLQKMKSVCQREICSFWFCADIFTTAKQWNQARCPSAEKWEKAMPVLDCYSAIKQQKKEFCHLWQNGQKWEHSANRNNSDPERQILYVLTHKKVTSKKTAE